MRCSKCGKEISKDIKFCIYCGEMVEKEVAELQEELGSVKITPQENITRKEKRKRVRKSHDDSNYFTLCRCSRYRVI